MKRKAFVDVSGIDLQLLKTLRRRNQVPADATVMAIINSKSRSDEEREADFNYSPYDALMLAFANHLVVANSFTRDSAARVFSGLRPGLPNAIRRAENGEEIWWCAGTWSFDHDVQPELEAERDDNPSGKWDFTEYGTFEEVHVNLLEEKARMKSAGGQVTNVSMFCMTPIVLAALDRAAVYGIDSFIG